jgi:UPF0755 protein
MNKQQKLKFFKYLILIAVVFFTAGFFSYYRGIGVPAGKNGAELEFTVARGDNVKAVGQSLEKKGLIKSRLYFELYVFFQKKGASLQAGTYRLSPRSSIKEIVEIISQGKVVSREKEITIIPGWTLRNIAGYFSEQGISAESEFYRLAGEPLKKYGLTERPADYSSRFDFLSDKPKNYGLEGYLFPDTYRIYDSAGPEEAVLKMLANFNGKFSPEMRQETSRQGKTIYQIITMASLIEKEVRSEKDMKIVSGIFWGRMKTGQALQSCATLSYILGKPKPVYSLEDTEIKSPYNTYQNRGLPPGPIANPSLAAIKAAIYPEETDYNYFLSRPDTGETVFSKTYEEHLRNQAKYLK